jgi:putative tryptophan/tyrosine transport system substrate-binding protein
MTGPNADGESEGGTLRFEQGANVVVSSWRSPHPWGCMRRREFITLIGGATVTWPLATRAQHPERTRRIVFLHPLAENDPEVQARIAAFRQALETLGWTENRNIQIEHRFSDGDLARIQAYTAELISSPPDLIVASSTPVIAALKQATRTIPIVFSVVNDPLGQGFVASLARPGGNITGFTFVEFTMVGKWLEMLKEIAPSVRRVALIFNPQTAPITPSTCVSSERSLRRSPPS